MKIGILETDLLSEELRQTFGSYGKQFSQLLRQADPEISIECFDVIARQYPDSIHCCDAYLITGSKFSAYQKEPWIEQLQDYILQLHSIKKPLIGICFGHQLIAHSLGGLTEKSNKGWGVGLKEIEIVRQLDWMSEFKNKIAWLVSHQDQVVRLPTNADLIATSNFCAYAAFQIEQHILCFQGHPEFSKDYLLALMNKRKAIFGDELFEQAVDSLNKENDSKLIAQWILKFIAQGLNS